jgi:hypothetical protein
MRYAERVLCVALRTQSCCNAAEGLQERSVVGRSAAVARSIAGISSQLSQANQCRPLISAACAAQVRTDGDCCHPVNGYEGAKTSGKKTPCAQKWRVSRGAQRT